MTCAEGCLDSPPQYTEPTPIPPQIFANLAQPPATSLVVTYSSSIDFNIPFRADDDGQQLTAFFIRDIDSDGQSTPVKFIDVPPDPLKRPFAEQQMPYRSLDWPWGWNADGNGTLAGCHTMTVIITNPSNFRIDATPDDLPVARLTWFLWLRVSSNDTQPVSCLQSSELGQKANSSP
ncbi:MAG TPA: hypothetical protein VHC69_31550 [Polyangiaceae bacterium]|nr:hypothetical protein [Polyangiaceae bacterium]